MQRDNSIHQDLLAQVEHDESTRAEIRRILSEPLTEADLDAQERFKRAPFPFAPANHAHRYSPGCSSCDGGLRHCATPEACRISDEADPPRPAPRAGDFVRVVALVLGAWCAVALVLVAMGVRL